jgi:hypothetical protein
MGDRFSVVIETVHLPDAGGTHNVNNFIVTLVLNIST